MSTTISISLYAEPANIPEAFRALVERMLRRSILSTSVLRSKYAHREGRVLATYQLKRQLPALAATLPASDQGLEIQLEYELISGRRIALDLLLHGVGYEDGLEVQQSGPMTLRFSHSQLAQPLADLLSPNRVPTTVPALAQAGVEVLRDGEELFLRACGLLQDEVQDSMIQHGAMYLEAGWPSPAACAMVFHREVQEFGRDVARIYREYNHGLLIPMTLSDRIDVWEVDKRPSGYLAKPGRNNRAFYQQFSDPPNGSLIQFLEQLDQRNVRKLSVLPRPQLKALLIAATQTLLDVESYDFNDQGLVLVTDPLSSVWRVYDYLVNHA